MSAFYNNWWLLPSIIIILVGILCPAIGAALVYKKKLLKANLISATIFPGIIISIIRDLDPLIGVFVGGVIGALLSELPSFNKNRNAVSVINIFTMGMIGFGVSLTPLIPRDAIGIDLETLFFGDVLTSSYGDLARMLASSFVLFIFFFLTFFISTATCSEFNHQSDPVNPIKAFFYNLFLNITTIFVICSSFPALGLVFVITFLSIPTILGIEKRAPNLPIAMVISSIFGLLISIIGFTISMIFNLYPGPAIGVICLILFLARVFIKDFINIFKNI